MEQINRMPVLFVGHGSPMNAIEDNAFTRSWKEIAGSFRRPKAILSVSAHWYTRGTRTTDSPDPKTVYDMYGFPRKLYEVKYRPMGSPALAKEVSSLLPRHVEIDNGWGIDHGTWSVLVHMYPDVDIPVVQLSIDRDAGPEEHYRIGRALAPLREEGVLLFGTGNVVHNLARIDWTMEQGGYPWADAFDRYIQDAVTNWRHEDAIFYERAGDAAKHAFYTPEHYDPLLYVLGAAQEGEQVHVFNEARVLGSLSMTGYLIG